MSIFFTHLGDRLGPLGLDSIAGVSLTKLEPSEIIFVGHEASLNAVIPNVALYGLPSPSSKPACHRNNIGDT